MRKLAFELIFLSLLEAIAVTQPVHAVNSINFPMGISELKSPDGHYVIKNFDIPAKIGSVPKHKYAGKSAIDGHYLVLIDATSKRQIIICTYLRNVDVFWSPDSSAFALTDWAASDFAEAYLYRVTDAKHPIDIGRRLVHSRKSVAETYDITHCSHRYVFVKRWSSASSLMVGITGHPETNFSLIYAWNLKNEFKKVERLSQENADRDIQ